MKRELIVLIVVLCLVGGALSAARHWTEASRVANTNFAFYMTVSSVAYSMQIHGSAQGADYTATLNGHPAAGHLSPAAYAQFLAGFVRAGGQGLDGLAWQPDTASIAFAQEEYVYHVPVDSNATRVAPPRPMMERVAPAAGAPALLHRTVDPSQPHPQEDRRYYQYRSPAPDTEERANRIAPQEERADTAVIAQPDTYSYQIEQPSSPARRFTLDPYSAQGRQLLTYLRGTVVFSTWQELSSAAAK